MSLMAPRLDDRTFQQLVDETKKRIPHYCENWTDHNVSDPGVTLIELFAWLTETTLYRLNRVPERHYIKFMEMLGMTLKAPVPAKVPVTFWLNAAPEQLLTIPAGTEVASTQTETERSIVFTTNSELTLTPPLLATVLSAFQKENEHTFKMGPRVRDLAAGLDSEKPYPVFSEAPQVNDALYFGFSNDISRHILRLELEWVAKRGTGAHLTLPPTVWEAATDDPEARWQPCFVETDTTESMNSNGRVQIHLPRLGLYAVDEKPLYWLRVRHKAISTAEQQEGMRAYTKSPLLLKVAVTTQGGSTLATHAQTMRDEFLGQSDGSTGQRFHLQVTPLLDRQPNEQLSVQIDGEPAQYWFEVGDFAAAKADSCHYTLDSISGELRFGPAIRQPDGTLKLYGAIPPRGANLIFKRYRSGGGDGGNVRAGVLNTLKTANPAIARVKNLLAAQGGRDAESLADVMVRAPKMMRHRDRAVTAVDFEDLAKETPGVTVGRVKCLQPEPGDAGPAKPGQVYVLVAPRVGNAAVYIPYDQLQPDPNDLAAIRAYLDERRMLTTRLYVTAPAYRAVAVRVFLQVGTQAEKGVVETAVLDRLHRFLNPFIGGPDGGGWPFGRNLFLADIYPCLQHLHGVRFVRAVELYVAQTDGAPEGEPVSAVDVVTHGVIVSGRHEVVFE